VHYHLSLCFVLIAQTRFPWDMKNYFRSSSMGAKKKVGKHWSPSRKHHRSKEHKFCCEGNFHNLPDADVAGELFMATLQSNKYHIRYTVNISIQLVLN